ncbi:pup deamidase/depupylase domain protein [Mycobacterium kansasii 662]|uniref:Pup deamidase/depupylase domain protein n=1 Tax=Mycobacterium kansasii 662 TaxID=1299326 RepID=X7XQM2_MYCKA|nr:pup deamidase/depupylase domain protein [Mycobacterium kansasii 662]
MGIRTSESPPKSKMTESQLAAGDIGAEPAQTFAAEVRPGVGGRGCPPPRAPGVR